MINQEWALRVTENRRRIVLQELKDYLVSIQPYFSVNYPMNSEEDKGVVASVKHYFDFMESEIRGDEDGR